MRPDFPTPEFLEQVQAAVKEGPAWWVYLAFVVLSFLGATLGFRYVGPGERIEKVEVQNIHQEAEIDTLRNNSAATIALLCEMSTAQQHRLARVECPR